MSRILSMLVLLLFYAKGVAIAASDENSARHRAYFKQLDLPYLEPSGCSDDKPCSLIADFNGDGSPDLAALYEYSGEKSRRNRWNLDLVIVYSKDGSSELTHVIFTHVGQTDVESGTMAALALQQVGALKIPAGVMTLERPGINIIGIRNTRADEFPTYYWRGEGFYAIDKSDD